MANSLQGGGLCGHTSNCILLGPDLATQTFSGISGVSAPYSEICSLAPPPPGGLLTTQAVACSCPFEACCSHCPLGLGLWAPCPTVGLSEKRHPPPPRPRLSLHRSFCKGTSLPFLFPHSTPPCVSRSLLQSSLFSLSILKLPLNLIFIFIFISTSHFLY